MLSLRADPLPTCTLASGIGGPAQETREWAAPSVHGDVRSTTVVQRGPPKAGIWEVNEQPLGWKLCLDLVNASGS